MYCFFFRATSTELIRKKQQQLHIANVRFCSTVRYFKNNKFLKAINVCVCEWANFCSVSFTAFSRAFLHYFHWRVDTRWHYRNEILDYFSQHFSLFAFSFLTAFFSLHFCRNSQRELSSTVEFLFRILLRRLLLELESIVVVDTKCYWKMNIK